jgi:uncharacterized protein (TIGR03067 family)
MPAPLAILTRSIAASIVCKHRDGQPDTNHFNLYFKKDCVIIHFDGTDPDDEIVSTFTLYPSRTPKQIDFIGVKSTINGYKAKGDKLLEVYKLNGDTFGLTMDWSDREGKHRPANLKHNTEKEISSFKFVRSKNLSRITQPG